jgi:hypothetical protein
VRLGNETAFPSSKCECPHRFDACIALQGGGGYFTVVVQSYILGGKLAHLQFWEVASVNVFRRVLDGFIEVTGQLLSFPMPVLSMTFS